MIQSTCPRCHMRISEERAKSSLVVCDGCGYVMSNNEERTEKEVRRTYTYAMWAVGILIVGLHLFFSQWGGYTLEVRWLQMFGGHGSDERLAQICIETYQYDCAEKHYLAMSQHDSRHFLTLGKFQMSRQNYKGAADSLRMYLSQNPDPNKDVTFLYARSLGEAGQVDEAGRYFEEIIHSKSDVIPITATQKYVELLVKHQRWQTAQKIIDEVRKRGENAKDFMQQQYAEISNHLGG